MFGSIECDVKRGTSREHKVEGFPLSHLPNDYIVELSFRGIPLRQEIESYF